MTIRPVTCLRVMTKKSSFPWLMAIFMSYCPQILGSKRICMACKTRYMFERYDQKHVVFTFYVRFHELLPTLLVFQDVLQRVRPDTCLRDMTKNSSFSCFLSVFMSYCPHF